MQKFMKDFCDIISLYHMYLWTSLCWKKVFIMQSPLLQHNCNKCRPYLLNAESPCLPITPFLVSPSAQTYALNFQRRIVNSVDPTLWRASLKLSTKAVYSFAALGAYTAIGILTYPLLYSSTYRPVIPEESNLIHIPKTDGL